MGAVQKEADPLLETVVNTTRTLLLLLANQHRTNTVEKSIVASAGP